MGESYLINKLSNCVDIWGGCDTIEMAKKYSTPLYIMDESIIRTNCRAYIDTLKKYYSGESQVLYASKALSCKYIYRIMSEEGMGVDVASGGELHTALRANFPTNAIYFHGNNKSVSELEMAIGNDVNCIIVDNFDELNRVNQISGSLGKRTRIAFRINPGVEAHTHEYMQTGCIDSKFGIPLEGGRAQSIVKLALNMPNVEVIGVHSHIGSQIFEPTSFVLAAQRLINFIADLAEHAITIDELNLGGGFGIQYVDNEDSLDCQACLKTLSSAIQSICIDKKIKKPRILLEPGRSIVGSAGITVYTVGSVKRIPGIRTYVLVDGGMTDNPRYALYGSRYKTVKLGVNSSQESEIVTIAGKCCESGDVLIKDIQMPTLSPGDLIAVLTTGAYNYSMASNYNRYPRPPIVMCYNGDHKLAVKRESYDDLLKNDVDY